VAIPANSMIISNITADGDIVFFTQTGGNSIEAMRLDASTRSLLLPQVDDAASPTLAFGDGNTGFYESGDNALSIAMNGLLKWVWNNTQLRGAVSKAGMIRNEAATATNPTVHPARNDLDTGLGQNLADEMSLIAGSFEMVRLKEHTAFANYIGLTLDAPDQVSLTSASGSTWRLIQTRAITVDWDGGTTITALNGQTAYFDVITNTADQATTVSIASTVYIVGAPTSDCNVTLTAAHALFVDDGSVRFDGTILSNAGAQIICDASGNLASANGHVSFGPADATSFTVVNGIITAIS